MIATDLICNICLSRGKESSFVNENEFFNHMEEEHGICVIRENETQEEARIRTEAKGIVGDRNICQCRDCKRMRI